MSCGLSVAPCYFIPLRHQYVVPSQYSVKSSIRKYWGGDKGVGVDCQVNTRFLTPFSRSYTMSIPTGTTRGSKPVLSRGSLPGDHRASLYIGNGADRRKDCNSAVRDRCGAEEVTIPTRATEPPNFSPESHGMGNSSTSSGGLG